VIPEQATDFNIIERIKGEVFFTDFGVPGMPIPGDSAPLSSREIQRLVDILKASWLWFDQTARLAQGKELRKGPRGGGRELEKIVQHVAMAEKGYLRRLGSPPLRIDDGNLPQQIAEIRTGVLHAIQATAAGQLPIEGPQRLKLWPLRYFFRRVTWHVVDHAWEIEDRIV
jgi:hypothetical protein